MEAFTVGNRNIVGLVMSRINELVAKSWLAKLDKKYKEKYSSRFPTDILHVRDLPTDVYHHIEVKLGIPISTARVYSCPRKYRCHTKVCFSVQALPELNV
jgi:hypothetical protein